LLKSTLDAQRLVLGLSHENTAILNVSILARTLSRRRTAAKAWLQPPGAMSP